jgi:DNA-binding transcriptional regulator YiaG
MERCRVCRSRELGPGMTEMRSTVDHIVFGARLPAMLCKDCGEAYLEPAVLERFELQVAAELARMGRPSSAAFRFMRKALGLRGVQLAELLGMERGTLSRWENGALRVDRGAFVVLGGLVIERLTGREDTLSRLRALCSPVKAPRRVVRIKTA